MNSHQRRCERRRRGSVATGGLVVIAPPVLLRHQTLPSPLPQIDRYGRLVLVVDPYAKRLRR